MGEMIRELRQAKGLSQAELAAELCKLSGRRTVSRHEVGRWESGGRRPGPYSLRHLAAALDVDVEDLLSVNRRQFVSAAALSVPAMVKPGSRGAARVSLGDVEAVDAITRTIHQLDNEFGGGHVYGIAHQCLNARVMPMLKRGSYTSPVGTKLRRSAARLGHLCGWTSYDMREHATAQSHFDAAYELSTEIGDHAFAGEIRAAGSHQAIHRHDLHQAMTLARQAREIAEATGVPALLTESLVLEANVHALMGDRPACAKALHTAEVALDRVTAATTPTWLAYMTPGYVAARVAHCLRDLGDVDEARSYAITAAQMGDKLHRTQASNLIMLATTYAGADPDEACLLGEDVLNMAAGLQSGRVVEYVRDLQARLEAAHPGRASVTAFAVSVRDVLGA